MSVANPWSESSSPRSIEYVSHPADVSMAGQWFDIASIDHFWIRRRFEVLRDLANGLLVHAGELGEIGCGHGLLQRQMEMAYHRTVTGFDLNEKALKQNVSHQSRICCYNILEMRQEFREKFDVLFLFDVLEHIAEEDEFLRALLFHLAPQGKLVINVPAGQWAFSSYDSAAGHVRRYGIGALREAAARNQLGIEAWTYWGLPLVPALIARKIWLMGKREQGAIIKAGFDSRANWINEALGIVSRWEPIPQKLLGTSLMAILSKESK